MLAAATGNCDVTNVTYNENKYYVVTYLESLMYLRRRQWLPTSDRCYVPPCLLVPYRCSVKVWPVLSLKLLLNQAQTCFLVNVRMRKWLIYATWSCEALGSLQIDIASLPTNLACARYCCHYESNHCYPRWMCSAWGGSQNALLRARQQKCCRRPTTQHIPAEHRGADCKQDLGHWAAIL